MHGAGWQDPRKLGRAMPVARPATPVQGPDLDFFHAEHLVDDLVEAFDIEISPPNANRSELGKDVGIKF